MMTPWVRRLLIANVVMFLVSASSPEVMRALMFVPVLLPYRPWTPVTYMFLHGGFMHLLFNMVLLYFMGPLVERYLGGKFGDEYARRIERQMMPHLYNDHHPPAVHVAALGDLGGAIGASLLVARGD